MASYADYKKQGYTDFAIKSKFGVTPTAGSAPVAPTKEYQQAIQKRDDDRWNRIQRSQGATDSQIAKDRATNQKAIDQQAKLYEDQRQQSIKNQTGAYAQPSQDGIPTGPGPGRTQTLPTDTPIPTPSNPMIFVSSQGTQYNQGSQFTPEMNGSQTPGMFLKPSDVLNMNEDQVQDYMVNQWQRGSEVQKSALDQMYDQSAGILDAREAELQAELDALEANPIAPEYQEQFDNTKELIEQQRDDAIQTQEKYAAKAGDQVAQQFSFSGFGRSSAHMEAQTDIKTSLQSAIQQISMQSTGQIGEAKIALLEKTNEKIARLEEKLDVTNNAQDQLALGKARDQAQLMIDIFNSDPRNPEKVIETAGKMAAIKSDLATAAKEEKAAMREEATAIFENAIKYGYAPDLTNLNVRENLAETLGVHPDQVQEVILNAIATGAIEKMTDKMQYFTDNNGNVTAMAMDPLTGEFIKENLGPLSQNRDLFSMQSDGMGGMYIMDKTSGTIVGRQDAFGNFTGSGVPEGNGLGSFSGGGSKGAADAILGSSLKQHFDTPVSYMPGRTKHEALDYVLPGGKGAPMESPVSGKVTLLPDKKPGKNSGFGNQVIITTDSGQKHIFSHMDGFAEGLENGAYIQAGQVFGKQGNTGYSQPPKYSHVHYEVEENGKRVNPESVLKAISAQASSNKGTITKEAAMSEAARRGINDPKEMIGFVKTAMETGALPEDREWNLTVTKELFDQAKPVTDSLRVLESGFSITKGFDVYHNNPSLDQSLIFSFMKVLDPGSVVREGEFNSAMAYSGGLKDQIGAQWNLAVNGTGMLLPLQRQNILDAMNQKYGNTRSNLEGEANALRARGDAYGVDPNLYLYIPPRSESQQTNSGTFNFLQGIGQALQSSTNQNTGNYFIPELQ